MNRTASVQARTLAKNLANKVLDNRVRAHYNILPPKSKQAYLLEKSGEMRGTTNALLLFPVSGKRNRGRQDPLRPGATSSGGHPSLFVVPNPHSTGHKDEDEDDPV